MENLQFEECDLDSKYAENAKLLGDVQKEVKVLQDLMSNYQSVVGVKKCQKNPPNDEPVMKINELGPEDPGPNAENFPNENSAPEFELFGEVAENVGVLSCSSGRIAGKGHLTEQGDNIILERIAAKPKRLIELGASLKGPTPVRGYVPPYRPFHCSLPGCGAAFSTAQSLEYHGRIHAGDPSKPFQCIQPKCGERFADPDSLEAHACKRKHKKPAEANQHGLFRPFQCLLLGCGVWFSTEQALESHTRIHEGNPAKPFQCVRPNCGERFAEPEGLKRHDCEYKEKKEKGPFLCPIPNCGKLFQKEGNLPKHIRAHSGPKEFKCPAEDCGRVFPKKNQLRAHAVRHTNDFVFECPVEGCGVKIRRKDSVKRHMMIHSGYRPYGCPYEGCEWRFYDNSNLTAHVMTHTAKLQYKCKFVGCGRSFSQQGNYKHHLLVHTGEKVPAVGTRAERQGKPRFRKK